MAERKFTIELFSEDNCFERARKIAQCTGIINCGEIAKNIAEAIQVYMDLDKREMNKKLEDFEKKLTQKYEN